MKFNYKRIASAILVIGMLISSGLAGSFSLQNYKQWGISRDEVISKYLAADKFTEFKPSARPEYENKIMNYIVAIDSGLKDRIQILRGGKGPRADYLFVDEKLYCVLEDYDLISVAALGELVKGMSSIYGKSNIQKDRSMTIYSFFSSETKVLVLASVKSGRVEVKAYYYASKLFKMLIMK
jgi:hypothetical protein